MKRSRLAIVYFSGFLAIVHTLLPCLDESRPVSQIVEQSGTVGLLDNGFDTCCMFLPFDAHKSAALPRKRL